MKKNVYNCEECMEWNEVHFHSLESAHRYPQNLSRKLQKGIY